MITRRLARPLGALSSNSSWTCPSCTRASFPQHSRLPTAQRRKKHHVPPLDHDALFAQQGVPGLLSPTGYQLAWTEYQSLIINKLNELTAGEASYNSQPKDLIIQYARDPMNASLFNHASMAFNNHFFFSALSRSPTPLNAPQCARLKRSLEQTFGTIDTLRATLLDTAAAMFGPGFVWLATTRRDGARGGGGGLGGSSGNWDWRILTTYNAGTPYPEAGFRLQGLDTNTADSATYGAYTRAAGEPVNHAGFFGRHSATGKEELRIPPGGTKLAPVLCVNTWEHVWIYDYGMGGKRRFLGDWWDAVDWERVEANWPQDTRGSEF